MSDFKIMTFDGGGIKGLVTAIIVQRLKKDFPELLERCSMYAGTSTGAIIALGLGSGLRIERIRSLYEVEGARIFRRRWQHWFGLTGAKYTNAELKKLLNEVLGDITLGELPQKVLVPAFDLMSDTPPICWKPKFFHNFKADDSDCRRYASDVALYSSSAPTYFKAYHGYVDGGMVANNPSMAAVAQALDDRYDPVLKLEDIRLLSIGTGKTNKYKEGESYDFGALQVKSLVDIMLGGTESVPDYQCKVILDDRYHRCEPTDSREIEMDDVSRIPELVEIGYNFDISPALAWLEDNWSDNA